MNSIFLNELIHLYGNRHLGGQMNLHEQIPLYEKRTDSYRSTNASKSTDTSRSIKADAFWWTYESILQWTIVSTKWKK